MPLRLPIKKILTARSDRVKSVEIFPGDNPWVLAALFSGNLYIWDYSTNTMIKSFETGNNPVRCSRFIVRKQWIVAGTDDMKLRVFNYNTMDKVKEWDAHNDYIRCLEIHPNRPLILSSSDDMSIKLWDWDKGFECVQVFEGHSHYVMMVRMNPRDTNTFASASLDKTIKVWSLTTGSPHFSLEGHEKGVNCLDYYPGGDKPYLLSGADDRTIKIWDYQTKACLQTLDGHGHNVSSVVFHPRLPLILSASEDGTVRLWHATTYRPETTLNYGLERAWCIAVAKDSTKIAVGYDEGTVVLKLGNERPVASLDTSSGKLVWAQGHDIQSASLKNLGGSGEDAVEVVDGERLSLNVRDMGACEVYPQSLAHNSAGTFIVVCGDGEYIVYTAQALRNKTFGSALDFVWSAVGSGDYAIRESISRVRTFKNFKEHKTLSLPISSADALYGGAVLGVKGPECVCFFDWDEGVFLRKIDVLPIALYWNPAGDSVVIVTADELYILSYDKEALSRGKSTVEEGVEGSFELLYSIPEKVQTGQWVGDCFLFTTQESRKLNYVVGGQVMTLAHLPTSLYLLGFVPKEDRVFLMDKAYNVVSYKLLLSVLSYQTAVVRQDFDTANALLPLIPQSEYRGIARFLESQGFKQEALAVTPDLDQKFELAVELQRLDIAREVLLQSEAERLKQRQPHAKRGGEEEEEEEEDTEWQGKWRRLGDLALVQGDFSLAETAAVKASDLSGLLLLYTSRGQREKLIELIGLATKQNRFNVAFVAAWLSGRLEACHSLLVRQKRYPEATCFARSYLPSRVQESLSLWKGELSKTNAKAAEALADPVSYPNLFPRFDISLSVEQLYLQARDRSVSSLKYKEAKGDLDLDLLTLVQQQLEARQERQEREREREREVEEDEVEAEEEEEVAAPSSPPRPTSSVTPPPAPLSPPRTSSSITPPPAPVSPVASSSLSPQREVVREVVREVETEEVDEVEAEVEAENNEAENGEEEEDLEELLAEEARLLSVQSPQRQEGEETEAAQERETGEKDEEDIAFDEGEDW